MVDVPRALDPSDAERLDVLRRAMTAGNVDGESRAVGPIFRRDQLDAGVTGGGSGDDLDGSSSQIDNFDITSTGTTTFTLTFDPIEMSWNVSCSWDLVNGVDYTIDGQTLTALDPATVFVGASGTYPKTLQVQYDYLDGVPASPVGDPEGPALALSSLTWQDEIKSGATHRTRFFVEITNNTGAALTGYYIYAHMTVDSVPPGSGAQRQNSATGEVVIGPVTLPTGASSWEPLGGNDTVAPNTGRPLSFSVSALSSDVVGALYYADGSGTEYAVDDAITGGWGPADGNKAGSFTWWPGREGTAEPVKLA